MKLVDLPYGIIDWSSVLPETVPGATGSATARSRACGEFQLRLIHYSPGYLADHWCDKGHIIFVVAGKLAIEHRDGGRHELASGAVWHVADSGAAAHRVVCPRGATVFIVD
jgi:hypothetical protein